MAITACVSASVQRNRTGVRGDVWLSRGGAQLGRFSAARSSVWRGSEVRSDWNRYRVAILGAELGPLPRYYIAVPWAGCVVCRLTLSGPSRDRPHALRRQQCHLLLVDDNSSIWQS